ncbi:MAG TPA: helix-turn-helix domain-containing protein [Micromonosporaceae bacterium]|jgi:transcriptional regulator with XRE-family HTH domain
MREELDTRRLARDAGRLFAATRARAGLSQERAAERAGTTQQWLSRLERGRANPRLDQLARLFGAVGARLRLDTAALVEEPDPDLLPDLSDEDRDALFGDYAYIFRVFAAVPHVIVGRVAALAQGIPVRPTRLDLALAERDLETARGAFDRLACLRWSERWQEFRNADGDPTRPGPMRWQIAGFVELRLDVGERLPSSIEVFVAERRLRVRPLAELAAMDPDVADVLRRIGH